MKSIELFRMIRDRKFKTRADYEIARLNHIIYITQKAIKRHGTQKDLEEQFSEQIEKIKKEILFWENQKKTHKSKK